ncbi:hypothetical protein EH30_07520 [Erythrobacter sp. JL475]|nr:hypothetical protein EH30_07520 [Erythrobacter sp. JL475]
MLIGALLYVELKAKISQHGLNPFDWPFKLDMATGSPGHDLFALLFIVPIFGAICLAIARHGERQDD